MTPPDDSFERRHPEIELAKQNEIAFEIGAPAGRAQLIPPLASELIVL
jgi:hypothetical protein